MVGHQVPEEPMTHSFTLLQSPSEPDTEGIPLGVPDVRNLGGAMLTQDAPGRTAEHVPTGATQQAARRAALGLVDPSGHLGPLANLPLLDPSLVWACHVGEGDRRLPYLPCPPTFLLREAEDLRAREYVAEGHSRAVRLRRLLQEVERRYPPFNQAPLHLEALEWIADQEGIRLFREPIPCLSCLCYYQGRPFILLQRGLSAFLQTFLLGHELGHHFFHPGLDLRFLKQTFFRRETIEQEANAFALRALLPTPALEWMIRELRSPSHLAIRNYLRAHYGDITFFMDGQDPLEGLIQERVTLYLEGHQR